MRKLTFQKVLQNSGWQSDVTFTIDAEGKIKNIETSAEDRGEVLNGIAIPGFQNAHSHAFQYAMSGMAEQHENADDADDFWGWRESMYELALSITPDQLYAIAKMLYTEMVRSGYTQVAEFHYVHHQPDGSPYDNLSEMGEALLRASKDAGIKITLIPIFYQKGGFGKAPNEQQRRFISSTVADYKELYDATAASVANYSHANIAIGIHSMRGVDPQDIISVAKDFSQDVPFHIHIAEQLKEVSDCIEFLGARPVEWFVENIDPDERFHLVHATHLTASEVSGIADSGANVVLCPSTEGNLGDGIFPLVDFQKQGGNWSIGTDSHIGIDPFEELRMLDYGQRLITHKRNIMIGNGFEDSGQFAINKSLISGRKAMHNFSKEYFAIGDDFDACILDASSPLLLHCNEKYLASAIVYNSNHSIVAGTYVQGIFHNANKNTAAVRSAFADAIAKFRGA